MHTFQLVREQVNPRVINRSIMMYLLSKKRFLLNNENVKKVSTVLSISALVLGLASCSASHKSSLDPITGIDISFCSLIKEDAKKANDNFWSLGKSTSVDTFTESMLKLGQEINAVMVVSLDPAKSWLQALENSGGDLISYFSSNNSGGSADLVQRAINWKTNYQELNRFCP